MENTLFKNIIENLKLKFAFAFKRVRSPNVKGGVNNQDTQIGHQKITQINNQHNFGINAKDAIDIVGNIVKQELFKYDQSARQIFITRNESLNRLLISEIHNLTPEERAKLADPDTQLIIGEGLKINGTLKSQGKRNILTDLVIKRIKNDVNNNIEELKDIVYSEAIQTIKRLTVNQLKIITLTFIVTRTEIKNIKIFQDLCKYLDSFMTPFVNFTDSVTDFEHIESVGCGTIQITENDVVEFIKNTYSNIFLRHLEKHEIELMNIPGDLIPKLFNFNPIENKYNFIFKNVNDLNKFLAKKEIQEQLKENIKQKYSDSILGSNEVTEMLEKDSRVWKILVNKWRNTNLKHFILRSTGIVLTISNIENTLKIKLDENNWIK